jgi:ArsR family transcriptional regulator, arsenate/arsenite/antimonite-responsive transcriptional repressor
MKEMSQQDNPSRDLHKDTTTISTKPYDPNSRRGNCLDAIKDVIRENPEANWAEIIAAIRARPKFKGYENQAPEFLKWAMLPKQRVDYGLQDLTARRDVRTESLRQAEDPQATLHAEIFSALGAEARLRIVRLLLAAHPEGIVAGEIGLKLGILPSTLSHHLDKLKNEGLVAVQRESTSLRYIVNAKSLQDSVEFLLGRRGQTLS